MVAWGNDINILKAVVVEMADDSNNSNFFKIVYTKVKTNGQTELVINIFNNFYFVQHKNL